MPASSKLKKVPVRPQPGLDVVDDQQRLVLAWHDRLQVPAATRTRRR